MEGRKDAVEENLVEEARKQNLDAVLDWIYSQPAPSSAMDSSNLQTARGSVVSRNVWDTPAPSAPMTVRYGAAPQESPSSDVPPFVSSGLEGIQVAGRAVPRLTTTLTPSGRPSSSGSADRTTRSQAEALQRLKEQKLQRRTPSGAAQPRRIMNYATQATVEAPSH